MKLKAPFDSSFLKIYGKVFKVFDDQDSGNIHFGVADGESKYFVKFAGSPMPDYIVNRNDTPLMHSNLKRKDVRMEMGILLP